MLGYEVKLRANKDSSADVVIIPDPTQTSLSDGVIHGWQFYAKIISLQHSVYLQIWRPVGVGVGDSGGGVPDTDIYALVGQTFVHPAELRFHEVVLSADQFIATERGDVIGLYFPAQNPIGWSAVPCAHAQQHHRYVTGPPANVTVGTRLHFKTAPSAGDTCRYYSVRALFGK